MLADTHCHLNLLEIEGLVLPEIFESVQRAGVSSLLQIATDLESSRYNINIGKRKKEIAAANGLRVYWTVGLHPNDAINEKAMSDLDEILAIAKRHRDDSEFWGLGETGLDYFHLQEDNEDVETAKHFQQLALRRHLECADELGLPVVLHLRDTRSYEEEHTQAIHDALQIVKEFKNVTGVLHCFTYTHKEALPFVELGWFVSYSGIITFKNAEILRTGISHLPVESLLVETDSPFLAPVPYRGKTNQPAYVKEVFEYLVDFKSQADSCEAEQTSTIIQNNLQRFFTLKKP